MGSIGLDGLQVNNRRKVRNDDKYRAREQIEYNLIQIGLFEGSFEPLGSLSFASAISSATKNLPTIL